MLISHLRLRNDLKSCSCVNHTECSVEYRGANLYKYGTVLYKKFNFIFGQKLPKTPDSGLHTHSSYILTFLNTH